MARACPQCRSEWSDDYDACPDDGAALVDTLIGGMLGSYRVLKQLGRGGMGGVFLAEHPVIGSRVAIKVLHDKYAHDEKIVDRFYNEARAVNVIGHDNVLKILDLSATSSGRPYFVMELLEGRSLQALLDAEEPVPLEVAGPMLLQICAALQAAHEKRIIHRDLKPDNIFLVTVRGQKNVVKVVDFGIARLTDSKGESAGRTRTGMVMGTPAYMSPEQGSGATKQIDARSDIYSLGVIMYQLATGRLPFEGKSFGELLAQHLQKQPLPPSRWNPALPAAFEELILKAMEKRQEDRFQSMEELGRALRAVLREEGIARVEPSQSPASSRRRAPALAETVPELQTQVDELRTIPEGAMVATEPVRARPLASGRRAPTGPPRTPTTPPRSGSRRPAQEPEEPEVAGPGFGGQRSASSETSRAGGGKRALAVIVGTAIICSAAGAIFFATRATAPGAARKSARAPARAQASPASPSLSITTEPPGARISATWPPGGSAQGLAPMTLQAPLGADVSLVVELDGYAAQVATIPITGESQTIPFALKPLAGSAGKSRAGSRRKRSESASAAPAAAPDAPGAGHDRDAVVNPFTTERP